VAKGGDCKSPALRLRRFESYLSHHPPSPRLRGDLSRHLKRRMSRRSLACQAKMGEINYAGVAQW
jgi:hypothetical protein